ncbi:hypothetical protein [Bhargavaea ginsengi]|uniref:hypothetical protein n=1 Tax=Bhargavaea ginsengi TaxID=426757 RepID=UPI001FE0F13E|nr:hypothetical protein [Bhargavaea ginsengi]
MRQKPTVEKVLFGFVFSWTNDLQRVVDADPGCFLPFGPPFRPEYGHLFPQYTRLLPVVTGMKIV